MRNFILTALLVLAFNFGYAQQNKFGFGELQSGKYLPNKHKVNFIGNWISDDGNYAVTITTHKKEINIADLNFATDVLIISFTNFIKDTNNLTDKMTPIEFISFEREPDFRGFLTDPITDNEVNFMLKRINNNRIKISAGVPKIPLYGDVSKGITFPNEIEFSRQKGGD